MEVVLKKQKKAVNIEWRYLISELCLMGGVFFTLITAFLVSYFCDFLSLTNLIVISLIASILGTIGDLVESKFKRQANTKDSGTIMPGHGGILDRLDSLLFVAPFVYLYINFII